MLVVGGSPEASSPACVARAALSCERVVAVDRGLDALSAAGLLCDVFCGDADSVSEVGTAYVSRAEHAQEAGASAPFEVERYDPHKDFTDLSLALRAVRERWGAADVVATCLTGGKPDHFLGVLGCLVSWPGAVEIVEDGLKGRILHAGQSWDVGAYQGKRFSFVPLSAEAVVSERHMRWELDRKRAPLLSDLGISNELDYPDGSITCHEGTLVAYIHL